MAAESNIGIINIRMKVVRVAAQQLANTVKHKTHRDVYGLMSKLMAGRPSVTAKL